MRPRSSGRIKLQGNDPFLAPLFYPNYFDNYDDMKTLIEGIKLVYHPVANFLKLQLLTGTPVLNLERF